jgi:hypothetical protein
MSVLESWRDAISAVNERFIPGRPDERPQLVDADSAITALPDFARERVRELRQRAGDIRAAIERTHAPCLVTNLVIRPMSALNFYLGRAALRGLHITSEYETSRLGPFQRILVSGERRPGPTYEENLIS